MLQFDTRYLAIQPFDWESEGDAELGISDEGSSPGTFGSDVSLAFEFFGQYKSYVFRQICPDAFKDLMIIEKSDDIS